MRVAVAILVGMQLLTPPGVCVCQFLPCGHHTAHVSGPQTAAMAHAAAEEHSECCCCRHRCRPAVEPSTAGPTGVAAARAKEPGIRPICPGQDRHAPGCP